MREFICKVPIEKGWSSDKKYCVTTAAGEKFLLRVSAKERSENRKALYHLLQQVQALSVPMNEAVDFWDSEEGTCLLYTWIDGEDLGDVLPQLPAQEQYELGLRSGEILQKIHSIPAPPKQEDWAKRFRRKVKRKIRLYKACGIKLAGAKDLIRYLRKNKRLLKGRPQCFQHGDYHQGNFMLTAQGLVIIDFDRYDFGDPWEEFNRIVWCAQTSAHFAAGMVSGYFGGAPPMEFWRLLAYYIASNTLSSVAWAIPFGQEEIDVMTAQTQDVLRWYDNMQRVVPSWYTDVFPAKPPPAASNV